MVIATPSGERRIPVTVEPGAGPLLPAGLTLSALRGTSASDGVWAEITLGNVPFRLLLGAALYSYSGEVFGLAAGAVVRRDTLFLPLTFLSDALPKHLGSRFKWDGKKSRLTDAGVQDSRLASRATRPERRTTHRVVLDAGHGDAGKLARALQHLDRGDRGAERLGELRLRVDGGETGADHGDAAGRGRGDRGGGRHLHPGGEGGKLSIRRLHLAAEATEAAGAGLADPLELGPDLAAADDGEPDAHALLGHLVFLRGLSAWW